MSSARGAGLRRAAVRGAAAGIVGVGVMTLGEKVEQALTGRPDSHVPGRAMRALMGRPTAVRAPGAASLAMHWGTGALVGALRGVWSVTGIRGAEATLAHTVVRLAFDQTVENATGVGAPPSTWPRPERLVDVAHKAVYSLVTGVVSDRLVPPALESRAGRRSH